MRLGKFLRLPKEVKQSVSLQHPKLASVLFVAVLLSQAIAPLFGLVVLFIVAYWLAAYLEFIFGYLLF